MWFECQTRPPARGSGFCVNTEEPGGLQSMGLLRVGHDWATSLSLFTFMPWRRKWQPTPVLVNPRDGEAWRIPGMGKPGGLPSMGLHRVGHNWSDWATASAAGCPTEFSTDGLTVESGFLFQDSGIWSIPGVDNMMEVLSFPKPIPLAVPPELFTFNILGWLGMDDEWFYTIL